MRTPSLLGIFVVLVAASGCGVLPERVSREDARLTPMFEAMSRVNRAEMGFTPLGANDSIRVEWRPRSGYDMMLHIDGRTSRTVAFRRTRAGLEWIGEQETFLGPSRYKTVSVIYFGEDAELSAPAQHLSLERVRPWLKRWGYY